MIPPIELKELHNTFWNKFSNQFNLTTNEGCGKYTESWVKYAQNHGWNEVGHLKKNLSQTQYNGHANDAFLYNEPDPTLLRAVDIIGAAESTDPNNPPRINWGIDEPRYTVDFWLKEPNFIPIPIPVPQPFFPSYEGLGGDALCRELVGLPLQADYKEANQQLNDGSVVWTNRTVYDALYFAIVDKMEARSAYTKSANKHRPEWRKELGLK